MIYTYFSPFGNKLPKSSNMHSAMRLSGLVSGGGVERTPRTKASVDVVGAGGVAARGGIGAVAASGDAVALEFVTGTAADL